jgi:hypothetical protein
MWYTGRGAEGHQLDALTPSSGKIGGRQGGAAGGDVCAAAVPVQLHMHAGQCLQPLLLQGDAPGGQPGALCLWAPVPRPCRPTSPTAPLRRAACL